MITVKANDSVSGTISIAPNAKNPRDLDIVVDYKVDGEHPTGERREYRMCVPFLLPFVSLSHSGVRRSADVNCTFVGHDSTRG